MTEDEQAYLILNFTCDMVKFQAIGQDYQMLPRIEKLIKDAEAFGRKAKAKEMAAGLLAAAKKAENHFSWLSDQGSQTHEDDRVVVALQKAIIEFEIAVEPEE